MASRLQELRHKYPELKLDPWPFSYATWRYNNGTEKYFHPRPEYEQGFEFYPILPEDKWRSIVASEEGLGIYR